MSAGQEWDDHAQEAMDGLDEAQRLDELGVPREVFRDLRERGVVETPEHLASIYWGVHESENAARESVCAELRIPRDGQAEAWEEMKETGHIVVHDMPDGRWAVYEPNQQLLEGRETVSEAVWCDECGADEDARRVMTAGTDEDGVPVGFVTCIDCGFVYDEPVTLHSDGEWY